VFDSISGGLASLCVFPPIINVWPGHRSNIKSPVIAFCEITLNKGNGSVFADLAICEADVRITSCSELSASSPVGSNKNISQKHNLPPQSNIGSWFSDVMYWRRHAE